MRGAGQRREFGRNPPQTATGERFSTYSDWDYKKGDGKQPFGEFELSLNMLYGSNGDRLFYWPNSAYPEIVYSGGVVPLGSWAYTRE